MATVNIGNLTFTHKGDYASGTAYVKNDVVYYATNGNAYIAKQGTTGNAPTNATYWNQFAAGSGGIWNAGLSLGSAEQVVRVNAAGNALEFAAASGGKIGAVAHMVYTDTFAGSSATSWMEITNYNCTITPTKAGSSILVMGHVSSGSNSGGPAGHGLKLYRSVAGASNSAIDGFTGNASGSRVRTMVAGASEYGSNWVQENGSFNLIDQSSTGLSYSVGQAIKYTMYQWDASGSATVINRSMRDSNGNDDVRSTSTFTLMEILA